MNPEYESTTYAIEYLRHGTWHPFCTGIAKHRTASIAAAALAARTTAKYDAFRAVVA